MRVKSLRDHLGEKKECMVVHLASLRRDQEGFLKKQSVANESAKV
jgi:hypothetical protein